MTRKTEGIVLRTTKHQDTHLVVRMLTAHFGIQDFIIKGYGSASSRKKFGYFQPLSVIELVYWEKPGSDLHKVTESRNLVFLKEIQTLPHKLAIGLVIAEIVYDSIKHTFAEEELYHFLRQLIVEIDEEREKVIPYFLFFLVKYAQFLGFSPDNQVTDWSQPAFFDMENGVLLNQQGGNSRLAELVALFLYADGENFKEIHFTNDEKRLFIQSMFQYYHYHIAGFKAPKTLQVFAELFG